MTPLARDPSAAIDRLLDRAVHALNEGDRDRARALAEQVLAEDADNLDAEELSMATSGAGEIRRLTLLFADLVDSTVLSGRLEPEPYRIVVGRYRDLVRSVVERYDGTVEERSGDGILALFGHPHSHEDDVRRSVHAGLDLVRSMGELSARTERAFGVGLACRVSVHRGVVYLDPESGDVYGFATNLAARLQTLAEPGTVVASDSVARLVGDGFELVEREPAAVKGVDEPVGFHVVLGERRVGEQSRPQSGPLVGRRAELGRLAEAWERVRSDGASATVVLRGEAGIGKTKLAGVARRWVDDGAGTVLELAGSPLRGDVGFHPVRRLIEARAGIGRGVDAARRLELLGDELASCGLDPAASIPGLAPVLNIAPETGYEPLPLDGRKLLDEIGESVRAYLLAALGTRPGMVLAEDVQWFDDSTRQLVAGLIRAERPGLLVVATARSGVPPPGGSGAEVVELAPLSETEADELIHSLDPTLPFDLHAAVHRRGDGIPLYIEQLVQGIRNEAPLHAGDGSEPSGVPEALYEPLVARLHDRADALPVVAAAATIGREVDHRLLGSVVDLGDDELDGILVALHEARVLEPGRVPGTSRFHHEMLREVAYELNPPTSRRALHGRIADALVERGASGVTDWGRAADHYERADRHAGAADAYAGAAADARRRGALAESRNLLGRAIEHVVRTDPSPARDRREVALRLERGFLAVAAEGNSSEEAATDFQRCFELCGTDVHGDDMFHTLIALWGYYTSRADLDHADVVLALLRATISEARASFRPENDAGFGMVAWFRGRFDEAYERLAAATDDALRLGAGPNVDWYMPNDPLCSMHTHLAIARLVLGDLDGAAREFSAATSCAASLGYPQGPFSAAYSWSLEAWAWTEAGELDRAAGIVETLTSHADRHGLDAWTLVAATLRASLDGLMALRDGAGPGELAAHGGVVAAFVEAWLSLGLRAFVTAHHGTAAKLFVAAGQLDAGRAMLDTALDLAADTGMHFYDGELLRLLAAADPERAAEHRGEAAALAGEQGARIFGLRVALDQHAAGEVGAVAALRTAVDRFELSSTWPDLALARSLLR